MKQPMYRATPIDHSENPRSAGFCASALMLVSLLSAEY